MLPGSNKHSRSQRSCQTPRTKTVLLEFALSFTQEIFRWLVLLQELYLKLSKVLLVHVSLFNLQGTSRPRGQLYHITTPHSLCQEIFSEIGKKVLILIRSCLLVPENAVSDFQTIKYL